MDEKESENNINNKPEIKNLNSSSYGDFALGMIYEKQNQEIQTLKAVFAEEKEKRNQDIEIIKNSILEELNKKDTVQLTEEQAQEEYEKEMKWVIENEDTEQGKNYLNDPINFACWYCYSRGLITTLKDWHIARQTHLKDLTHWKDVYKIFDSRQSLLNPKDKLTIKEDDLIIE